MKLNFFNKRNLVVFITLFVIIFIIKVIGNKLFGGMYSPSRAYSWERIIEELPLTFLYSTIVAFLVLLLDKKDQ